jgi:hypothetical protein
MRRQITVLLFLVASALSLSAAESTNRLGFPASGFSIAPLEFSPGTTACQALMMFLPPSGGFAGNVNVQIQPYNGTISEYTTLSLKQFKDAGLKLIAQKKAGASGVIFEYSGELRGKSLHWYARSEKMADHVYLVTATADEQDWPKQAAQLKSCVDSFRCESGDATSELKSAKPQK